MKLLLRIGEPSDPDQPHAVGSGRLVEVDTALRIGRAADNDLVLPDPERVVSKQHCIIRQEDGRYVVVDLSANGTFLNDNADRLVRDRAVPLVAGDAIRLGGFTLTVVSVILPDEDPTGTGTESLSPVSHAPTPSLQPPQPWPAPRTPQDIDAFLDSINGEPGSGEDFLANRGTDDFLDEHAAEPWRSTPPPVAADPDHVAPAAEAFARPTVRKDAIPDDWDPLAEIGSARRRPDPARNGPNRSGPARPDAVGSIGGDANTAPPALPRLDPGYQDAPHRDAGGASATGAGAVKRAAASEDLARLDLVSPGTPQSDFAQPHLGQPGLSRRAAPPAGIGRTEAPQSRTRPPGPSEDGFGCAPRSFAQTPLPETSTVSPAKPTNQAPQSVPHLPSGNDRRHAIDILLVACGIDPATLSDTKAAVAAERAGHVLRIAVDGMLQILGSRSAAKQEFGMQRTAISRGANNALKFVSTAEEALQMLLCNDIPGFLPPEDAMRETVTDINAHHLALLSGVRVAFADTLRRLDPTAIEQTVPHHATDAMLPVLRKARAWEAFRAKYAELERALAGDGHDIFGSEFARAYASIQTAVTQARSGTAEAPSDV
jgi:type VI secretion system protein